MWITNLKKPCHDDGTYPFDCCEDVDNQDMALNGCNILVHGGTWEDCRFGKKWKEPGPPAFEGD